MILSKAARSFASVGKQTGFFRGVNQSSLILNSSRRFYSNEAPKDEKKVNEEKTKEQKKEKTSEDIEAEEEAEEAEKKKKSKIPPFFQSLGAGLGLTIIVTSVFSYLAYNYKKDITEEERYRLKPYENKLLTACTALREGFDNIFANLSDRYEIFDSLFGPGEVYKILPPQLPGSKKYTLVIDIDALSELSKLSKYPTIYKRAGLDFFLENLKKDFDIYLFFNANVPQDKIEQLFFKIDPNQQYFIGQIYSDHGLKDRNQFTKKIEMLDRDPAKVILIDATAPYKHPNVINVGKFHSNSKDTILVELLPVLLSFPKNKVTDIRPEIKELQDLDNYPLSKLLDQYMGSHNINPILKRSKTENK